MKTKQILTACVMALALSGCGDVAGAISSALATTAGKVEDTIASLLKGSGGGETSYASFAVQDSSSENATPPGAVITGAGSEVVDGKKYVTIPTSAADLEKMLNLNNVTTATDKILPLMSFSIEAKETADGLALNKRINKPMITYVPAATDLGDTVPAGYTLQLLSKRNFADTNPKFYVSPTGEGAIEFESEAERDTAKPVPSRKARAYGLCAGTYARDGCDATRSDNIKGYKGKYSMAMSWIVQSNKPGQPLVGGAYHRGSIAGATMYTPYTKAVHDIFAASKDSSAGALVYDGHYSVSWTKGASARKLLSAPSASSDANDIHTGTAKVTVRGVAGDENNAVKVTFESAKHLNNSVFNYSIDGKFDRIKKGTMLVFAGALKEQGADGSAKTIVGDASGFFAGPNAEEVAGVFSSGKGTKVDFAGSFWGKR